VLITHLHSSLLYTMIPACSTRVYTNLSIGIVRLSRKIAASTRREKNLRLSRTRSSTFLPCSERHPLTHDPYSLASPSLPALSGRVADHRCLPGFVTSTVRFLFRVATSTTRRGGKVKTKSSIRTDRLYVERQHVPLPRQAATTMACSLTLTSVTLCKT
jgi:hypothetical protein